MQYEMQAGSAGSIKLCVWFEGSEGPHSKHSHLESGLLRG